MRSKAGGARLDWAVLGMAGTAWHGQVRTGKAGEAWHGEVGLGMAKQGRHFN